MIDSIDTPPPLSPEIISNFYLHIESPICTPKYVNMVPYAFGGLSLLKIPSMSHTTVFSRPKLGNWQKSLNPVYFILNYLPFFFSLFFHVFCTFPAKNVKAVLKPFQWSDKPHTLGFCRPIWVYKTLNYGAERPIGRC